MKTQMALALAFPLVWSGMWYFLTRKRLVKSHGLRVLLVSVWIGIGFLLRARDIDPHIPGVWELFLFPILPFLQVPRFVHAAYSNGASADHMVFYEVFGMVIGFAILAECVLVQRFIWTGYHLRGEFARSHNGTLRLKWAKALAFGVSLTVWLWLFFLWLMRSEASLWGLGSH